MLFTGSVAVAQTASLRVKITDETNTPLAYATGIIQEINYQVAGDESGELYFKKSAIRELYLANRVDWILCCQ
ncbi:hypothetical protein QW060_25630 [Myroides ceti]|uniref:Uncharacterized protein n=1 Tax=Paenimyroides ceti TaxID=395087 RepID=A0ABT8D2V2_9FLAO|nr:hypothetical protein [Paenimyroides ceti]MDN3710241.1 hypothetical protein [Paenimyroides ceti]